MKNSWFSISLSYSISINLLSLIIIPELMQETQKYQIFDNLDTYLCKNKHQITKLCANRYCTFNSLMCQQKFCECDKPHIYCQHINFQSLVNKIKQKKTSLSQSSRQVAKAIEQIYDEIIDNISKQRAIFLDQIQMFGIGEKTLQFMDKLHGNQEQINITGKLINEVRFQSYNAQSQLIFTQNTPLKTIWHEKQKDLIQQVKKLYRITTQNQSQFLKTLQVDNFTEQKKNSKVLITKEKKYTFKQWIECTSDIKNQNLQLTLTYHALKKIPAWLQIFQKIQYLNLTNNMIEKIERLQVFHNLKILNLNKNMINKIENLQSLKNLNHLKLCFNNITVLQNLDQNPRLNCLEISKNKGIVNISHLRQLLSLKTIFINEEDLGNPQQLDILKSITTNRRIKIQKFITGVIYNPYRQKLEQNKKSIQSVRK